MKNSLNHTMRLLGKDGDLITQFDFHGDNKDLAREHVEHTLNHHENPKIYFAEWKRHTATNWRLVKRIP